MLAALRTNTTWSKEMILVAIVYTYTLGWSLFLKLKNIEVLPLKKHQ